MGAKSGGARAQKAKELLEQGFLTAPNENGLKVAEILNLPQGAIVPADMTTGVCRSKTPVQLADGKGLEGWAVSFGTYDDMTKADMALRGRLLSPIGIDTRGAAGVVRLPDKAGYAAMIWQIPQDKSLAICAAYRAENAHCDVMPPALVTQIASYVLSLQPIPRPVAQGSDEQESLVDAPKKKKRAQKKRR